MKEIGKILLWRRQREGLLQKEVAKMFDTSASTYGDMERGKLVRITPKLKEILNSEYIMGYGHDPLPEEFVEVIEKYRRKYRIPEIPEFMERLNDITNEAGYIDVPINDPRLQDLRELIGGPRVYTGKDFE